MFPYFYICRHWLYGDKVLQDAINGGQGDNSTVAGTEQPPDEGPSPVKAKGACRIRGWFPRQCAVEVFSEDQDNHHHKNCEKRKSKQPLRDSSIAKDALPNTSSNNMTAKKMQ